MLGIDFAVVFGRGASWRGVFACGRGGMQSSGNIEGAFARYGCCLLDVLLCLPPIGARKSEHFIALSSGFPKKRQQIITWLTRSKTCLNAYATL